MENNDFVLGKMQANVDNLTEAVNILSTDMRALRFELEQINFFRAKVLGAAFMGSFIVSAISTILFNAAKLWAR